MKLVRVVAMLGALLVPVVTSPASAQSWKWDLNVNGGYSWFNDMLSAENSGISGAGEDDLKFEAGPLVGAQLTFWPSTRIGIRVNGTYADNALEANNFTMTSPLNSGLDHVNLWSASGDLLFRFVRPDEDFDGMEFLPYLALGLGAKWHNPAGDAFTCRDVEEGKTFSCAPLTIQSGSTAGSNFALAEANSLMGLVGLGADWRIARSFAIRTEVGDRIWDARLHATTGTPTTGNTITLAQGDTDFGDDVHEIYAQAGLTFLFGVARPEVVAVVAPPAPVEPEPAPVISREAITVCVIDPTAPGGIRLQTATLVGGRDTVVVVGGTDRPLTESVGNVVIASNADWFVRGQPLVINVGDDNTLEFLTVGSTRMIESGDLAFVGTLNGMAVYADRDDVADIIVELDEINRTRPGTDLSVILTDNRVLRTELEDVDVLYVPTAATGCVFQAVQLQEQVRKGK
ncbi:MAG: hypothetical protein ACT443_02970 [Gemmatimonadota bacterium]